MDTSVFEKSYDSTVSMDPFVDKEILYVNDSNNGSYSSSLQFDSTIIANSQKWIDYSEGIIQIPYVISLKSDQDIDAAVNSYMMALKSGSHHLIDSIQVQCNNSNAVQQQSFTNFYVNYKVLSTWSGDSLTKWGSQTLVSPDSPASYVYQTGTGARGGTSFLNNRPYTSSLPRTYTDADARQEYNKGLQERVEAVAPSDGWGNLGTMDSTTQMDQSGKTYFQGGSSGADSVHVLKLLATIRLKDLSDFFENLPLTRGLQLRMNIIYNSARVTIDCSNGHTMTLSDTNVVQLSGNTVPFMLSDSDVGQPMRDVAVTTTGNLSVECGIVSTSNPAGSAADLLSACRLYVPAYIMSPLAEQQYLSLGEKRVEYTDIYQYTIKNVNTNFQQILTNGITNPVSLIIVPVVNSADNQSLTPFKSPFDSCPATTAPLASITNFNVLISGRNLFQQDIDYDFNIYQNEIARSNALTGAVENQLTSGLLSRFAWENGYRYYVVDLSRREESDDVVPLSIQVKGKNNTSKNMDYYCFVVYKRSLTIDLASGSVKI